MDTRGKSVSLPLREDDLWPPGELLHLIGLWHIGQSRARDVPVAVLTQQELRISGARVPESNPTRGYSFDPLETRNTVSYPTSDIARVVISHWGVTRVLSIWVRKQEGGQKKILKMFFVEDIPGTIVALTNNARDQGLLKPGIQTMRYKRLIFDKELERRFKRAAPNAEVVLKGRSLADEDFRLFVF